MATAEMVKGLTAWEPRTCVDCAQVFTPHCGGDQCFDQTHRECLDRQASWTGAQQIVCQPCVQAAIDRDTAQRAIYQHGDGCPGNCSCWI
jgi:hypothetical protein